MIYLAAPLSAKEDFDANVKLAERLRRLGFEVGLPQEIGTVVGDVMQDVHANIADRRAYYFKEDLEMMKECSTFVMYLHRMPSSGACWEMGWAFANDLPCIGFNETSEPLGTFLSQGIAWTKSFEELTEVLNRVEKRC